MFFEVSMKIILNLAKNRFLSILILQCKKSISRKTPLLVPELDHCSNPFNI